MRFEDIPLTDEENPMLGPDDDLDELQSDVEADLELEEDDLETDLELGEDLEEDDVETDLELGEDLEDDGGV